MYVAIQNQVFFFLVSVYWIKNPEPILWRAETTESMGSTKVFLKNHPLFAFLILGKKKITDGVILSWQKHSNPAPIFKFSENSC